MTRPTTEIIGSLRAALAELEHSLGTDEDISLKLREALQVRAETRAEPARLKEMHTTSDTWSKGLADDRSANADPAPKYEHPKRLRDYTPASDEGFDESVFMGTGDRYDPLQ